MRLERVNSNRIKIHLTFDDLYERGLTKEDIWKDSIKWQYFFHEMLEEANDIFDIEIHGSVSVEIFSMKAQGMIMILTISDQESSDDDFLLSEGFLDMQVTVEETIDLLYEFKDIEDVISSAKQLKIIGIEGGTLYSFNDYYYLYFSPISTNWEEKMVAVLSEYAESSLTSIHLIEEYGKLIQKNKAIQMLTHFFSS
ncbi:adaptor protein MecA [Bacillus sp. B1-b2]|uniref:adaptor protein MecA n=1 Tax=Bacillus sp. B1-b2 TaxID=2653201 RepID=UPI0012622E14|nr:adaptor protein MecA [Bacillus sp. B1-b2]KAB7672911.1 adaptor protein [Bacillus sp. B1-b2]